MEEVENLSIDELLNLESSLQEENDNLNNALISKQKELISLENEINILENEISEIQTNE